MTVLGREAEAEANSLEFKEAGLWEGFVNSTSLESTPHTLSLVEIAVSPTGLEGRKLEIIRPEGHKTRRPVGK